VPSEARLGSQADAAFAMMPQAAPATITPAGSGGGGGALDVLALLGLAGVGFAGILRLRPRVLG
jgi:hypothetical protein